VSAGVPGAPGDAAPERASILATVRDLRATREHLRSRPVSAVVAALGTAGARFLDPEDAIRREALDRLPRTSGLSPEMCEVVLDGMAADWTPERLGELVEIELGDPRCLDDLVENEARSTMAVGPALCVQIGAGGVPGVGVTALLRSLLVKAPTLLKPGHGDALLPELYARSLAEVDEALARSLAVVCWPSERQDLLEAALGGAEVVVVYGSDETVAAVRAHVPATTRLVAYHHRISVGVVGRDALTRAAAPATAAALASAVSAYDRRGCVSPQVIFVEEGAACAPAELADLLARAMEETEKRWPSGALDPAEASRLHQARGTAEMMAAAHGGSVHHGGAWTVTWEPRGWPTVPVAGRFVRVRPIRDATDLPAVLQPLRAHLQTVGIAGLGPRARAVAVALGEVGASRVTPFQSVPFPPPWWHHDGRGPLLDLVRWVDLEVTPPGLAARLSR